MTGGGAALALAAVLLAGPACSPVDEARAYRELAAGIEEHGGHDVWEVIPARPRDVRRVVVEGEGRAAVEVVQSPAGLWRPGAGASPETGLLLEESEDHLFPLLAYRKLDVDAADPDFGFAGGGLRLTAETVTGERWTVRVGGRSPSGGGWYARRDGGPSVYVIVREAVNDLRSLLAGRRVLPPPDPLIQRVAEEQANPMEDPEEVTNPWLAQILDVEGDASPPG